MHITRETDYAVRCVLYLSKNPDSVSDVNDISEAMGIPKTFVAKILQRLAKAGIARSTRGVKGGFKIAGNPSQLSLLHVIEAVQGPLSINLCVINEKSCVRSEYCSVHPAWIEIQHAIEKRLKQYTFGRLAREDSAREKEKKSGP